MSKDEKGFTFTAEEIDTIVQRYIAEVPLYRELGRSISNKKGLDLLRALPCITKQEIRRNFPRNFLRSDENVECLLEQKKVEVEHTAGTTDSRTDLLLDYGWWARQEKWALRLNQKVAEVLDAHPEAHRVTITSPVCNGEISYAGIPSCARRTLGATRFISLSRFPFLLSDSELERMVEETLDWQPLFLDTDPVYAVVFALYCERRNIKLTSLRFIITSYEFTSVVHRRILRRVFGVPIYNLYGATETGHLLFENECGEMVPSLKVAHLDVPTTDERGVGELVVSTLSNHSMPLLRYRIGDLVEQITSQAGGSSYRLHGRVADTLKSSTGKRVTTRDVDQCFIDVVGMVHYRLHEVAPGKFTLTYIPDQEGPATVSLDQLVGRLSEVFELTTKAEVISTGLLLPEGSGKFVFTYPYLPA